MELITLNKELDVIPILNEFKGYDLDEQLIEIISNKIDKELDKCFSYPDTEEIIEHFKEYFYDYHLIKVENSLIGIQKIEIIKELLELDLSTLEKIKNENRY